MIQRSRGDGVLARRGGGVQRARLVVPRYAAVGSPDLEVVLTNALILLLSLASADVGPAPACPAGTYSQYCMGRRCVPDGKALDEDCQEIDGPKPLEPKPPAPEPTPDPSPPPTPAPAEPAKPAPAEPAEQKGCSTASGAASSLLVAGAMLALRRRRRS